jgi:hypothetical protein
MPQDMSDITRARPRLELMKFGAFQLAHVDASLPILQLGSREHMGSNLPVHTDERVMEEAWLADGLASDPLTDVRLFLLFL